MSEAIRSALEALLKTSVAPTAQRVHGGCINTCYRYETKSGPIFVKAAPASSLDMFAAEVAGLDELRKANALRVPNVIAVGAIEAHALLVLEWLELAPAHSLADRLLGEQLAQQHRLVKPLFGFKRHNYIGSTPQINYWSRSWLNFFREHRLEAQLNRAEQNGADENFLERASLLLAMLDQLFAAYTPVASLLHGDLWSGNYAVGTDSAPVIFDPAVYYGDRECDLAMTRLFGGFSSDFYAAYEATWALDSDWPQRSELYNLYHVLNHFNLFGDGYLSQAETIVNRLLAELGH